MQIIDIASWLYDLQGHSAACHHHHLQQLTTTSSPSCRSSPTAQLIKSRTVVQIRTHAQKYFQKMTKARQNGEEGEVIMEGRGGVSSVASVSPTAVAQTAKRRRPATGTKRKAIQSVVSSAIRQGKKMAAAQVAAGVTDPTPPLPSVAPILAHFIIPQVRETGTTTTNLHFEDQTTISGPALEDSMYVTKC